MTQDTRPGIWPERRRGDVQRRRRSAAIRFTPAGQNAIGVRRTVGRARARADALRAGVERSSRGVRPEVKQKS